MRKNISLILLAALLAGSEALRAGEPAEDAGWWRWRGPKGNGVSMEKWDPKSLADGPKILWRATVGSGPSAVSISGKRAFTMGNVDEEQDCVYCLDVESGKEVWRHTYESKKGPQATPLIQGGCVFTVSWFGHAFSFDEKSGKVNWHTDLLKQHGMRPTNGSWGPGSSFCPEGNLLLLNGFSEFVAIDRATGKVVWKNKLVGGNRFATPVVAAVEGRRLALVLTSSLKPKDEKGGCGLFAVDVKSGEVQWSTEFSHKTHSMRVLASDPVMVDDAHAFVTAGYDGGCALFKISATSASPVWTHYCPEDEKTFEERLLASQVASPVLVDRHIYGLDGGDMWNRKCFLVCLDPITGKEKWRHPMGVGTLMAADGKLIVNSIAGVLTVVRASPESYQELCCVKGLASKGKGTWTVPTLYGGRLYYRTNEEVLCIDVK